MFRFICRVPQIAFRSTYINCMDLDYGPRCKISKPKVKKQMLWGTVSSEEQGLKLQKVLGFLQKMTNKCVLNWK